MTKIKIRTTNNSSKSNGKLLEICVKHSIKVVRLVPVSDGFLCFFFASPDDADELFAADVYRELICEVIMPQQLRAIRSAFLRRMNDSILTHTAKKFRLKFRLHK